MEPNDVFEASLMSAFLKKEEAFYKKALEFMEQEYIKLEVEELALKAAIRQELINIETSSSQIKKERLSPVPELSTLGKKDKDTVHGSKSGEKSSAPKYQFLPKAYEIPKTPQIETVTSNITDDRYLEPLILNPSAYDESSLVEFDD